MAVGDKHLVGGGERVIEPLSFAAMDTSQNAPQAQPAPAQIGAGLDEKERLWGMLAHVSPLVIGFVGPLIIMLADTSLVGHPSPFVKHAAKQSLIWSVVLIVVAILTCGIGALVMMVWQVIAALEAHKGNWYVYPGLSGFVDAR